MDSPTSLSLTPACACGCGRSLADRPPSKSGRRRRTGLYFDSACRMRALRQRHSPHPYRGTAQYAQGRNAWPHHVGYRQVRRPADREYVDEADLSVTGFLLREIVDPTRTTLGPDELEGFRPLLADEVHKQLVQEAWLALMAVG